METNDLDKIPKEAKLLHEYAIFKVYGWEREMFNGTKRMWQVVRRQDAAKGICVVGDKIVITRQQQVGKEEWFYSLPGGLVGWDEKPEDAFNRELVEETGYASEDVKLYKVFNHTQITVFDVYMYIARNCKIRADEITPDDAENIELEFVTYDEFFDIIVTQGIHNTFIENELLRIAFSQQKKDTFKKLLFG